MPRKKKLTTGLENLFPKPAEDHPAPESESPPSPKPAPAEVTGSAEDALREPAPPPPTTLEMPDPTSIPDVSAISKQSQQVLMEALNTFDDLAGEDDVIFDADGERLEEDEFKESLKALGIAGSKDQETQTSSASKMLQIVIFKLADEVYGVDIAAIEQIIELQRITTVPRTPAYIAGLTNLRGTVLPVIDLRKRLELPVKDPTRETRIIVAQIRGARVGMIVDAVTEVLHIPESSIEPPSPLVTTIDSTYIIGIAKLSDEARSREVGPLVVLVDLEQILPDVSAA